MKAAALSFILPLALLASASAWARDSVLPAGTLLTCTMDEPNFSSATASVGDPVLCHPHGLQVFGQTVFPRGTYIVGHLADDKDPGHFWGKGYMKIEFDRIGLPGTDLPLSAKMIAVSGGYKVDKEGKIKGKGHAKRDIIEWLFPPLWPWKLLMLPARGPRPALKGETRVTLRLMEDVIVPDSAGYQRFGRLDSGGSYTRPALYLRPRTVSPPSGVTAPAYRTISWQQQGSPTAAATSRAAADDHSGWRSFRKGGAPVTATPATVTPAQAATAMNDADADADDTDAPEKAASTDVSAAAATAVSAPASAAPAVSAAPAITLAPAEPVTASAPAVTGDTAGLMKTLPAENTPGTASTVVSTQKPKVTLFALKAGTVYAAADYWRDDDHLVYLMPNGKEGQVDMGDLDWKTTTQLNADRSVKVTLREGK
ncbi:MAG TPA: hypothetical protein VI685_14675 [Candidatus Angelobacter sp.]